MVKAQHLLFEKAEGQFKVQAPQNQGQQPGKGETQRVETLHYWTVTIEIGYKSLIVNAR